jgi:hypothetical protein
MYCQEVDRSKKERTIEIRPVDPATVSAELQLRLEELKATHNRLEAAKVVSQETMQLEVSI